MNNPLEVIEALGIPTTSPTAAIQFLNDGGNNITSYGTIIQEMTGVDYVTPDPRMARYTFLYVIQNLIKDGTPADFNKLVVDSSSQADSFIKGNAWVFSNTDKLDEDGNPKQKKGGKKEKAKAIYEARKDEKLARKDWIKIFVDEVGLTPAGASTYIYNFKKGVW